MDFGSGSSQVSNGAGKRKQKDEVVQQSVQHTDPQVVYVASPEPKRKMGCLGVLGVVFILLLLGGIVSSMNSRSTKTSNEAIRQQSQVSATPVSGPTGNAGANSQSDSQSVPNNTVESESASQGEGRDFAISIDDAHMGSDITGSPCLIVDFTFTNVSNERGMSFISVGNKAYQNGVECSKTIFAGADSEGNEYRELKPGASISVSIAYTLVDTTTPVDVEVTGSYFSSDVVAARTFTL